MNRDKESLLAAGVDGANIDSALEAQGYPDDAHCKRAGFRDGFQSGYLAGRASAQADLDALADALHEAWHDEEIDIYNDCVEKLRAGRPQRVRDILAARRKEGK